MRGGLTLELATHSFNKSVPPFQSNQSFAEVIVKSTPNRKAKVLLAIKRGGWWW